MNIYELLLLGLLPLVFLKFLFEKLRKNKIHLISLGKQSSRKERLSKLINGLKKQGWKFEEKK